MRWFFSARRDCFHHDRDTGRSHIHPVTLNQHPLLQCTACGKKWKRVR